MHKRLKGMLLLTGKHKMCKSGGETPVFQAVVRQVNDEQQERLKRGLILTRQHKTFAHFGVDAFSQAMDWQVNNKCKVNNT